MRPKGTPLDVKHAVTRGFGLGVAMSFATGAWDVGASKAISKFLENKKRLGSIKKSIAGVASRVGKLKIPAAAKHALASKLGLGIAAAAIGSGAIAKMIASSRKRKRNAGK